MSAPVRRKPREYSTLLDASLRSAGGVIKACQRDKIIRGDLAWLLSLLASIASSGYSIRTLLRHRRIWDCLLISRRMHEAAVDVHYILANPENSRRLREAYLLERAEDDYRLLRVVAARDGKTVKQLIAERPNCQRIIDAYSTATAQWKTLSRKRRSRRRQSMPPKPGGARWMFLSWQEKAEGAPFGRDAWEIFKFVMHEGNAVAHSRPHHLKVFGTKIVNGTLHFSYGPVSRKRYHFNPWVMTMVPLLWSAQRIAEEYRLAGRLQAIIKSIMDEIKLHGELRERR